MARDLDGLRELAFADGATPMSGWQGFILALITIGSVCAAYWAGQQNILIRFRDMEQRRRERERRWEEFED